jgi:hypothetical protein
MEFVRIEPEIPPPTMQQLPSPQEAIEVTTSHCSCRTEIVKKPKFQANTAINNSGSLTSAGSNDRAKDAKSEHPKSTTISELPLLESSGTKCSNYSPASWLRFLAKKRDGKRHCRGDR